MTPSTMNHLYEILASALEYPDEELKPRLDHDEEWLTTQEPDLAARFAGFRRNIEALTIQGLEELYTRTFDLNPVCTLDIGYHLFGENYKRGELLARLRETEAPYELGQANQLPDYLPVLLRLLDKLEDDELRLALIREILIPALGKMLIALNETDNPYRELIEVIMNKLMDEAPEGIGGQGALLEEVPELYRISSLGTHASSVRNRMKKENQIEKRTLEACVPRSNDA